MKTEKAKTVVIELGGDSLSCLVHPDGSYSVAASQLAEFFHVPQKHAARDFKRMLPDDFQYPKQLTDLNPRKILVLDLMSVGLVAVELATKGDKSSEIRKKAKAYLVAAQAETIERRIDKKLNIVRAEEERNERFKTRVDGIISRHFWTDVIDHYMKTHEVSEDYKRWIYINVSDMVNLALFGIKAAEVREHYDLPKSGSVRDFIPSDTLKLIDCIEKSAGVRVMHNDVDPKQSLKDVIGMLGIQPDKNRL